MQSGIDPVLSGGNGGKAEQESKKKKKKRFFFWRGGGVQVISRLCRFSEVLKADESP
jgi:hypothetical protein